MRCRISRELLDRFACEASRGGAAEVCGLLLGSEGQITDMVPVPNVAAEPFRAFELDAAAHLAASRAARAGGKSIVGHYHSHPVGLSTPSPSDASQAEEQGRYWLIIADEGIRLWISRPGGAVLGAFDPVEMEIA